MTKKLLKYISLLFLALLGLFLLMVFLLQFPVIQTKVTQQITQNLSKRLNSKVAIKSVEIDFFNTLVLEGIYIEDQEQDTLVFAQKLGADISLFSLSQKNIFLNEIRLTDAVIHLNRNAADSTFNYQFLINAFQTTPKDNTSNSPAWDFSLDELTVQHTHIRFKDALKNSQLNAQIDNLSADVNAIDFTEKNIDLKELVLSDSKINYQKNKFEPIDLKKDRVDTPLAFPNLGWDLKIATVNLQDNQVVFENQNAPKINTVGIDFQHLDIATVNFSAKAFSWIRNNISTQIETVQLADKSGFVLEDLQVDLSVDSTQIALHQLRIKTPHSQLNSTTNLQFNNFSDLADIVHKARFKSSFDQVQISFHDLKLLAPAIRNLQQINTNLKENLYLNGTIEGTANDLTINNLNFKVGNEIDLLLDAQVKNSTQIDQSIFDIQLKKLVTSYQDLDLLTDSLAIPKGLAEFGQFTLSGRAIGKINDFSVNDFFLQTASSTFIRGRANLAGLPNKDSLYFDLVVDTLQTQAAEWKGFLKDTIPAILDSLGKVQFAGKVVGTVHDIALNGHLNSAIGELESDLKINFDQDYSSGNYSGDLRLIDFALNQAFPGNQLGSTSLQVKGQGSGFVLDSLIANAEIIIDSFAYNNYTYRDILIDGQLNKKDFDGKVQIADEHLKLDFDGTVNLQDSIPKFVYALNLDTLNLLPLHFTKKPLSLSLDANINLEGNALDKLAGKSLITNFTISNDIASYQEDSIFFEAHQPSLDSTILAFQSDFLRASIKGNYELTKLPFVALNYINDFFPVYNLLDTATRSKVVAVVDDQQVFDFDIQIADPTPLTMLFIPQLTQSDGATIEGSFNRKQQDLAIQAIFEPFHLGAFESDQLIFEASGSAENLKANVALLDSKTGILAAPLSILDLNMANDSLRFAIKVTGETLDQRLNIQGLASESSQWYDIKLTDQLILNGKSWEIDTDNYIHFLNNELFINNLQITNDHQKIAIQSENLGEIIEATPPIKLSFTDFEMTNITTFLSLNQNRVNGLINGDFTLNEPFGTPHYLADLQVKELVLNQDPIGEFFLKAQQAAGTKTIAIAASLEGLKNKLTTEGTYTIDQQEFDLKGMIQEMELRLLNPFTEGIISDSRGQISGDFVLGGTPTAPDLNGRINLQETNTIIDFLGTRVLIPQHTITFNNRSIILGKVDVSDEQGQTGVLQGVIGHQFFTDFEFDLQFLSPSFQVMNTTVEQNPLFFGQLFADVVVDIRGSLELPTIDVEARTLENSVFNLQPLIESEEIATDDYIIFANYEKYKAETASGIIQKYKLNNAFNLNLVMNLDVNTNTLMRIIIDPLTGDQIEGRGNSNMVVSLNPAGEFKILGDYIIESGVYNFSYQNLVKKKFDIESGSKVSFNGDPLKARFDITAVYNVKTGTYEFIKNEVDANSSEAAAARKRSDIKTLLYLKGLLEQPDITFDIQLMNSSANDASSTVARKLTQLRGDQGELNKQAFALLIFDSFIASDNAGQSLVGAGQNIALSSVSKLLSNQLNNLAGKYLKGFELNFDLASYQSNFQETASPTVELGVGLSQKLFNDRITFKADADFNLANQSNSSSGSNIAGNFILEYQLTESGSYLIRVFRLSDLDIVTNLNTEKTGVGIDYRKAFGKVRNRKSRRFKEKKIRDERRQTEK